MNYTIICNPGETYRGMLEECVSEAYHKMAIEDYDKIVQFSQGYNPEIPDYITKVGEKENRDLMLTLYAWQPVASVAGKRTMNLESSSYLFNPSSEKGLPLVDLDVTEFHGYAQEADKKAAANSVADFYKKEGWKVSILNYSIEQLKIKIKRFCRPISIINPKTLLEVAKTENNYNPEKLYF